MTIQKYERKISAKVEARIADLAERLYNYIPDVCWITEVNLAKALNVSPRQIKNAKAYLESTGRIKIELSQNGKRANPIHTLIKPFPINQVCRNESCDESSSNINWSLLDNLSARDLNELPPDEKLDFYEEMRLPFIPLHFPKFGSNGRVFCSCPRGRNCESIGKHPATAYKSLDFSSKQTFKAMKSYWQRDARYNVGFIVDGFTVIDVDFRHGGAYSLELLQEIYGELPQNLMVKSGNGLHFYTLGNHHIKNGAGVLGMQGIDIRSKGSVVVTPFSDHHLGRQYEWHSVSSPVPLPKDLIADLQGDKNQKNDSNERGNKISKSSTLPSRFDKNYFIPKGRTNDTLFRMASRERGKGAEQAEIYDFIQQVNATYCQQPLSEKELNYIAGSVMRFPTNREKAWLKSGTI